MGLHGVVMKEGDACSQHPVTGRPLLTIWGHHNWNLRNRVVLGFPLVDWEVLMRDLAAYNTS